MSVTFPRRWPLVFTLFASCALAAACTTPTSAPAPTTEGSTSNSAPEVAPSHDVVAVRAAAFRDAMTRIQEATALPLLPGAPVFESNRAAMVARAKSEPVLFTRAPRLASDATEEERALREQLVNSEHGWRSVRELRKVLGKKRALAQRVLLPDGYLYSETPQLAFALVSQVKPSDLFDAPELWVQRGSLTMRATKDAVEGYVYADGPEVGSRLRLLHLDRVSTIEEFPAPIHRDLRSLRGKLHFERAKLTHITETVIVAELRYGEYWVPSLLKSDGAALELVVEAIDPSIADALETVRDRLRRKSVAVSALRDAMRAMIEEGLPFDEPKTEVGQEDGKLRPEWARAYRSGRHSYEYNGDRYDVFDRHGRPRVPQVCIDFMIDTFERAGGAWWLPRSQKVRQKTTGRLNLGDFSRSRLRQSSYLRELAVERTDMFEVWDVPPQQRIELGYKDQFFAWLGNNADQFQAGDMILIRGLTPWDEVDEHTHSFFIYDTDPVTGVPIAIAGNAGPANLWSWETEARRTPKRTVRTRIRPKLQWLETFIDTSSLEPIPPPPLVAGRK